MNSKPCNPLSGPPEDEGGEGDEGLCNGVRPRPRLGNIGRLCPRLLEASSSVLDGLRNGGHHHPRLVNDDR